MKFFYVFLLAVCYFVIFSCSKTEVTRQESGELESVNASAIPGLFKKRVFIQDYIGTWCGNCAVVSYAIEKVYENPKNNSVTVAIHSGPDPLDTPTLLRSITIFFLVDWYHYQKLD